MLVNTAERVSTEHHANDRGRDPRVLIAAGLAAGAVLVFQLARLLLHTRHQYNRFNLSVDFAIFHQAWHQIAHGHVNPTLTSNPIWGHGVPFWRSHFELMMWPLSLLYWLNRNDGLTLLVIQDLAIVAAETIGIWWMIAVARTRRVPGALSAAAVVGIAVLAATNPWLYSSAQQDFHFEALAACFAMAAAYHLWAGHKRLCWLFVALTLSCGDVAGIYIAGIGLAFACTTPRLRRPASWMLATGVAWVLFIGVIGANQGSPIGEYGYLAVHQPISSGAGGAVAIVHGVLAHPSRPIARLNGSWLQIGRLLGPTGVLGLINPWTWGVIVLTLLVNVLNAVDTFREPVFQNFAVYLFATTGTGLLVVLVVGRRVGRTVLAGLLLVGALVSGLWFDTGHHQFLVYPATVESGLELQQVRNRTPGDAQVIATFGVVGRFAGRRSVYTFIQGGNTVPIDQPVVVVVLAPTTGNQPTPPGVLSALRALFTKQLRARTIWSGPTVSAYEWRPGPGQRQLAIP
jgi:hypothetical protein